MVLLFLSSTEKICDNYGICDGDGSSCAETDGGGTDGSATCTEVNKKTWYKDGDGDGFGDDNDTKRECDQPPNYVDKGGDCDDNDAPADLGEDIRSKNSTNTVEVNKTSGNELSKKGGC